jgi:hypothetical protein
MSNINNFFGDVSRSQLQQTSEHSSQTMNLQELDVREVAAFIEEVKKAIPRLELEEEAQAEIVAEIRTVESQITSPKPKTGIIKESLKSIGRILEGAAAGAIGTGLLSALAQFFS